MAEKLIVQANTTTSRRNFLKQTLILAGAAFVTGRMPLLGQDAKASFAKVGGSISDNGDFYISSSKRYGIGTDILNKVTKNGEWKVNEAWQVDSGMIHGENQYNYIVFFSSGVVVVSDKTLNAAYKEYPGGIQSFQVLEPGKGETVRMLVNGQMISGRIVGSGYDKEIKLESGKAWDVGISSGQATEIR